MSLRSGKKIDQPLKVVDLTFSVWETMLGNYFFGQTEQLNFGNGYHAWGALLNPSDSGVDLYWNVYTFSNYSGQPYTAEVWLNSASPGKGTLSKDVASANQAIKPPSQPKVELRYGDHVSKPPTGGLYAFTRRVEPDHTLTRHDFQGMIIIPPGGSVITYLKSPDKGTVQSIVAFGWWEQKCQASRDLPGKILPNTSYKS